MTHPLGVLFAFLALFGWGFGDFFIQKTTRAIGSWHSLFFIGLTGFIFLFPFVLADLQALTGAELVLLLLLGIVAIFTSLFDFEAIRQGKIAIVEPIIGLELPITVGLSLTLANESFSPSQLILIGIVFFGIILAITTHFTHLHYHKRILEKGVVLAGMGAIGMGLTNFLVGVTSQNISPLVAIWFAHSLLAVICTLYLVTQNQLSEIISDLKKHPKPILGQSILDNLAWVSFAKATTLIPIAITTTISESYIALTVLLGLLINREKVKPHQLLGIALSVVGIITLAYIS